jgi:hypothetical protein
VAVAVVLEIMVVQAVLVEVLLQALLLVLEPQDKEIQAETLLVMAEEVVVALLQ